MMAICMFVWVQMALHSQSGELSSALFADSLILVTQFMSSAKTIMEGKVT